MSENALVAGSELDRVIAERLGWTAIRQEDIHFNLGDSSGEQFRTGLVGKPPKSYIPSVIYETTIPSYSTDLNAAIELLDRLRPEIEISSYRNGHAGDWDCSIRTFTTEGFGRDKVLALAICKAWLAYSEASA